MRGRRAATSGITIVRRGRQSSCGERPSENEVGPWRRTRHLSVDPVRQGGCRSCLPLIRRSSGAAPWTFPVLGEQSVAAIVKGLGISASCLRNWMTQADADEGKNSSRLSSDERDELAELRKKAKRLDVEDEILKHGAAYFARENVLPK